MSSRIVRRFRTIEAIVCGVIVTFGLSLSFAPQATARVYWITAIVAGVVASMFELRILAIARSRARVRGALGVIAANDFDRPEAVAESDGDAFVEGLAANRTLAHMVARRSTRLFAAGSWKGQRVEIGTFIVSGRDFDQFISYVCAAEGASSAPFRLMSRGAVTTFARVGMDKHPVATGDAAFDEAWVVDADVEVCRAVLDPALRSTLVELRTRLAWMQVSTIEVTRFGLVMRWPGELTAGSAAYLRDLVLDVQRRLQAVVGSA